MAEYEITGYSTFDLALRAAPVVIRGEDKKKLRRKSDIVFANSPPASIPFQISLVPYEIGKNPRALAEWIIKSEKEPVNSVSGFLSSSENLFSPMSWSESSSLREQLGFNAAKLNLLLCQHSTFQPEPWKNRFSLDFEYISKRLFRKRLTEKIKTEIYANLAALSSIWVKAAWVEDGIDSSFEVTNLWRVRMRENDVVVYPGYWTESFLNKKGEEAKIALHQIGRLSKSALDLGPKYYFILRLEIFLGFSKSQEKKSFKLRDLVDCVSRRSIEEMQKSSWDSREVKRGLDNLAVARKHLVESGYQFEEIPEIGCQLGKNRKRGDLIADLEKKSLTVVSPPPDPKIIWGYEVREIRQQRGESQRTFAKALHLDEKGLRELEQANHFEMNPAIVEKLRSLRAEKNSISCE